MFSNNDILTLARAGFNAQQIAALNTIGSAPAPAPAPAAPAAPAPAAPAAPAPAAPAPAPAPAQGATIDDVLNSITGLTQTFQNGFMLNAQQPKPATAEDILASIINPPTKD